MSKIKQIKLRNFKFFNDKVQPIDFNGKHMLIYGENGSGKSSIYWALYTLLEASLKKREDTNKYFLDPKEPDNEQSLVNLSSKEEGTEADGVKNFGTKIIVSADNDLHTHYELSVTNNNIWSNPLLRESRMASDFINYQSLYEITRLRSGQEADLASVFVDTILPYYKFNEYLYNRKKLNNAGEWWKKVQAGVLKNNPLSYGKRTRLNDAIVADFNAMKDKFDDQMEDLIGVINGGIGEILKELDCHFDATLSYEPLNNIPKDGTKELFKVKLTVQYNGVEIRRPHKFLNEAKLVAIAIAIRMVILHDRLKKSSLPDGALKMVVFDDVMISLDMVNRRHLMRYVKEHLLKEFQVIFLTHDERFYRYAKIEFHVNDSNDNGEWKCIELCSCEDSNAATPQIIQSNATPLEKAKVYFDMGDYETSSMWVRKALEQVCANALPKELCIDKYGNSHTLAKLWDYFVKRYKNDILAIAPNIISDYESLKLAVLNPSAHYNRLSMPIYRGEVERAINITELLWKENLRLPTLIAQKGDVFLFTHPTLNYYFSFRLEEDLMIYPEGSKQPKNVQCSVLRWEYQGKEYYDFGIEGLKNRLLSKPNRLGYFMKGIIDNTELAVDEKMFLSNTELNSKYRLSRLLGTTSILE